VTKILIATTALVDAGTLTGGGTLADALPVTNLQTQQPGEVARWTSLTGMYFVLDLLAAAAVNVFALLAHNGTSAATWRVRGATSESNLTAAPGYDSGTASVWPATGRPTGYDTAKLASLLYLTPSQTYRWWRADITDAANAAGYFEAGRLIADAAWAPARNLRADWELGYVDPAAPVRAARGHLWPGPESNPGREWDLTIRGLSEDDAANGYELGRTRGARKDILAIRNPELTTHLHRNMVYGLLAGPGRIRRIAHNWYEQPFKLTEFPT